MSTLKTNWWIASITTILLLFGAFVVVKAMGENTPKPKKIEIPTKIERVLVLDTWYFSPNPADPDPDPNLATNYSKTRPTGVLCGGNTSVICSIEDEANDEDDSIPQMSHGDVTEDDSDLYAKSYRQ